MKRAGCGVALLVYLLVLVSGCGNAPEQNTGNTEQEEEGVQIGMCFDSFVIERWQRDRDVFVSTAKEHGAEVNVQNANGDIEEQIRQVKYFIEKKMDVIVIIGIDGEKLVDVVQEAKAKGIKVICYDRIIRNAGADLYISFDNEEVGRMMAHGLVDNGLPDNRVIMLQGPVTDYNVKLVREGFMKVMDLYHVKVIDRINCDGWRPEIAGNYIYDNPETVAGVSGIMCGNDSLASQAVHALSEKRLAGKIAVVGQDAELEACQRIVEGTQVMTVYKPVEKLAQAAAEYAIFLAEGGTIEGDTINDGSYDIPYVVLQPIRVDENNINEVIINSGFHLKEDVYLNVPSKMPE